MSVHKEIQETLDSPGMAYIVRALRAHHKAAFRKYRTCGSMEELLNLQTIQKVIDTTLPQVIHELMNKHVAKPKKPEWSFMAWIDKIRSR